MLKRTFQLLLVALLGTGALWAADNPFVGDWKLNPSRSKLTDVMKLESLAPTSTALILGLAALRRSRSMGRISPAFPAPPSPSPSRALTAGRWCARRTAARC